MRGANETITVWNRWRNPVTQKHEWFRCIVPNCSWETEIVAQPTTTGAVMANTYNILVSEHQDYRPPTEWEALPDKSTAFTFRPSDIVALGKVTREITGIEPETEARLKDALAPNVFTIKVVADRTQGYKLGRHYEVSGV